MCAIPVNMPQCSSSGPMPGFWDFAAYLRAMMLLTSVREELELGSGPWASYQMRKIAVCACAGNVFPATAG